jgi:replication factor A1
MEDGAQWANTPLVAVKGARISDFNGISLGMTQSSNMQINPDIPEAHTLYSWYAGHSFPQHV